MIRKRYKIFNDPVYGFVQVPKGIILDIIDHPYFQRLRRIKQVGMTDYVYPGANHTRFHHAVGAYHLMTQALQNLRLKGIEISDDEFEAAQIAILLHDIGHGPYSHALEHRLVPSSHESIGMKIMERMNKEFDGQLSLSIDIFKGSYHKRFLSQLVSGQLDVDRMDYLTRDSFYTGVSEGVIGYDRLIKMMTVKDDSLVLEEKARYSIEKFLMARRLMYWQVYLHKTAISAEHLLIQLVSRCIQQWPKLDLSQGISEALNQLLQLRHMNQKSHIDEELDLFLQLDDVDIMQLIKRAGRSNDRVVQIISDSLLNRKLFRVLIQDKPFEDAVIQELIIKYSRHYGLTPEESEFLLISGAEEKQMYASRNEIMVMKKDRTVVPYSTISDINFEEKGNKRYFLGIPKEINL